ncbi:signal peptidase I [Zophobihabitans entericus]|uniref:Signal peptidase I n=1 Tax=Zophobihabitans entericus TaxID=1635327 RepID=A0A6G9IDL3_9GAMM|nr:signal peptidase I [Zophobihabitans entericus]QIQ21794.1 signal peptidase I [Zophobihabitans entericus]
MAGSFAIILTVATFITGILWCLERFKWAPARQRKVEEVRKQTEGKIDGNVLAEVGKPKNWVDSLASLFPVLFVVFVIRSFIYEPFQIPSGSMMPNLLVGDFIAVEKFAYGIKDPITNTTLIPTGTPERGDVVVFKYPRDTRIDFIKRVVGLPGDKITYNANTKQVTIYPACQEDEVNCQTTSTTTLNLQYSPVVDSNWQQVFSETSTNFYTLSQFEDIKGNLPRNTPNFNLKTRTEHLGEDEHAILTLPMVIYQPRDFYKQADLPSGEWIVPEGQYFMMGDNRDNSEDSRFWGFVPEKNLVGRATFIWLSLEKQPDEWPTGIRFSQMGRIK